MVAMVLLCLHVVLQRRSVIPWTVSCLHESMSFVQLFDKLRAGNMQAFEQCLQNAYLVQCSVSRSREGKFDIVDRLLPVDEVCYYEATM